MVLKLALIGQPVSHSLSPPLHRAAFSYFGIDGSYELIELAPQDFAAGIDQLLKSGFGGFNLTIPHKQAAFALAKQHSQAASLTGAANTLRIDSKGCLSADNTDLGGFRLALNLAGKRAGKRQEEPPPGSLDCCRKTGELSGLKALLLGAGGAARACLTGLLLSGCDDVVIGARRPEQAKALHDYLNQVLPELSKQAKISILSIEETGALSPFTLLVNATPLGLSGDEPAPWLDSVLDSMESKSLVFDSVYKRDGSPTTLELAALRHNLLPGAAGLDMLAAQAALSFECWTGRRPPFELLRGLLPA